MEEKKLTGEKAFTLSGITEWLSTKAKTDEDMYYVGAIAGTYLACERLQSEKRHISEEYDRLGECFAKLKERNAEQKAEIERLTELNEAYKEVKHIDIIHELSKQNAELQKQVDELTELCEKTQDEYAKEIADYIKAKIQQAIKDTAKEIYFKVKHESGIELSVLNDLALWIKERFGVAVEKWIKVDSVEVE